MTLLVHYSARLNAWRSQDASRESLHVQIAQSFVNKDNVSRQQYKISWQTHIIPSRFQLFQNKTHLFVEHLTFSFVIQEDVDPWLITSIFWSKSVNSHAKWPKAVTLMRTIHCCIKIPLPSFFSLFSLFSIFLSFVFSSFCFFLFPPGIIHFCFSETFSQRPSLSALSSFTSNKAGKGV